jgi:hypothetical protein
MHEPTHQTVRLAHGKHRHPGEGVCVMELASMLAGESFSDHPSAVCPVVGAVLRAYNDGIGDERRQDLYRFAALAVGTRAGQAVRQRRIELCRERILQDRDDRRRRLRRVFPARPLIPDGINSPETAGAAVARLALRRAKRDASAHAATLRFIERLIAVGSDTPDAPWGVTGQRSPSTAISVSAAVPVATQAR